MAASQQAGPAELAPDPEVEAEDELARRDVVFVGGTGRSGTHVLGRLLGRHSSYAGVPIECRFHTNKKGIPDLLEGRVTLEGFVAKLRDFWWHRIRVDGQPRGLYNIVPRPRFEAAVERFAAAYHDDPVASCRALFCDLLWPLASEAGKPGLVEMSSHNIRQAQTLLRLFPRARLIHTVRDGRDAASSVTTKTWGPDNVVEAIDWWADRLRRIEDGVRGEEDGAAYFVDEGQLHVIVLDDLVSGDRERAYRELLAFLDVADEDGIRGFFDGEMSPRTAHQGRWREGLGRLGRWRVERKYERMLADLEREGNHCARPLIEARERSG